MRRGDTVCRRGDADNRPPDSDSRPPAADNRPADTDNRPVDTDSRRVDAVARSVDQVRGDGRQPLRAKWIPDGATPRRSNADRSRVLTGAQTRVVYPVSEEMGW